MSGKIIAQAIVVPMDGNQDRPWFIGDVAFKQDLIVETGNNLSEKYPDFEIIPGQRKLVTPGLINCHTHAAMTLLRSYADDMPLQEWLSEKIWPLEAHLKNEDIYWGSKLAILEMIKSGTTTFADMYFFMDKVAEAVKESGIRALLSRGMIGSGENGELAMRESEEFVKKWHGMGDGRINCCLGPHAPYTCTPKYLERVMKMADDLKVGLHIHLAETMSEIGEILEKYGMRPVELMDTIGIFDGRHVLGAHLVHLAENEMEILVKKRVGIAHNPESNMKLASGVAPIPRLLAKGALVGLGTDGAASNNNLDMVEEMHSCALLHKVTSLDPLVLPAYQVLDMATRLGAQALGIPRIGSIKAGYKADMIIFDMHKPHLTPLHDPIANIVYAAKSSDISTVIINGTIIMKDRIVLTMDEEEIVQTTQKVGQDLVQRQ